MSRLIDQLPPGAMTPELEALEARLDAIRRAAREGQPAGEAAQVLSAENPATGPLQIAGAIGAGALTAPLLAGEAASITSRILAEVLQPTTNTLSIARWARGSIHDIAEELASNPSLRTFLRSEAGEIDYGELYKAAQELKKRAVRMYSGGIGHPSDPHPV
jgi:hypothetical protein